MGSALWLLRRTKSYHFVIKGISTLNKITGEKVSNKLTTLDRFGNVLFVKSEYENDWIGKDGNGTLLPKDTYYYNFVNGENIVRGYFEIRYE